MIIRLRENDQIAWEQFVELYAPLIYHWSKVSRLSSADSADVMQEVFSAVSRAINTFEQQPVGTLRGWLWTITQNKIRDLFRQRNIGTAQGGTSAQVQMNLVADSIQFEFGQLSLSDEPSCDSNAETSQKLESYRFLHRALKQIQSEFSERSWTAFWRNVVEGDKTKSIAEDLGISAAGVRQAKRRILRRLRQQLGDIE